VAGIGAFGGNGIDDILWHDAGGQNLVWIIQGDQLMHSGALCSLSIGPFRKLHSPGQSMVGVRHHTEIILVCREGSDTCDIGGRVMRTLALAKHSSRLGKKSKLRLPREFPNLLGKLPPLAGYVVVRVFRYGVPRLSRQPLALLRLGQAPFDSRRVHGRQFSRVK
jgi:hypothetical protein